MARAKTEGISRVSLPLTQSAAGGWASISGFQRKIEKGKDDSNSVKNQRDLLNDFTDVTLTSLKVSRNM